MNYSRAPHRKQSPRNKRKKLDIKFNRVMESRSFFKKKQQQQQEEETSTYVVNVIFWESSFYVDAVTLIHRSFFFVCARARVRESPFTVGVVNESSRREDLVGFLFHKRTPNAPPPECLCEQYFYSSLQILRLI